MRLFKEDHSVDRSSWKSGPWDSEPDYYEWITAVGYKAYMGRLSSGCWAGIVIAPDAPGNKSWEKLKFYNALYHMSVVSGEFSTGHSSLSDTPGMIEYCSSASAWECPGESKMTWFRGPYKTIEEFKQRMENLATAIFKLHNDPSLYESW